MEINKVVFIGAGNLATNLGQALVKANVAVTQVYSRTFTSARLLGDILATNYTNELNEVIPDADLYIVSIKDDALMRRVKDITLISPKSIFVHTAGSIRMDIFEGCIAKYGVFYPMQTFSKEREVDFQQIPIFLEANSDEVFLSLEHLAKRLTQRVYKADSLQRKYLHLSAVFACNFVNHMYAISAELLEKHNLPFEVMLPLIDETARKVHTISPSEAQTGPAVRYDQKVIAMQKELLADDQNLQELYMCMSQRIHQQKK
jgi:predicted short-subunit dehydrogenase-like oxidoreductase (DUF2520 family)